MRSDPSIAVDASASRAAISGWLVAGLFVVSVGLAALPVFSHPFLSINDYLNHLARSDVLLHFNSKAAFSRFYIPHWRILPNLALDLWVFEFGRILPVELAGKLFVAVTLATVLGGVIILHRVVFNKWSLWPFLASIFLYNRLLLVGIVNYLFGIGLWLLVFALWIKLRHSHPLIRASLLLLGELAVFFVHLFAFGILAVTIAACELVVFGSGRRPFTKRVVDLFVAALPFLPAIALLVLFAPHSTSSEIIRYRDLWTRILAFAAPILYDWRSEVVCYFALGALVLWMVLTDAIRFDRRLAAGVIALFVLQFCIPNVLMTAEGADRRLPIPMMLLAIAATDPKKASREQCLALILTTGAIFAFRIATVEDRWSRDPPAYMVAWTALSKIPPGARVATAFAPDVFDNFSTPEIALYYLPVWRVVPQGGFTQTLFASPTQQPLILTPNYANLAAATSASDIWQAFVIGSSTAACKPTPRLIAVIREYDYVAFVDRKKFLVCDNRLLRPVVNGRYVQVFRVSPGR
jgi:hypothetical protein